MSSCDEPDPMESRVSSLLAHYGDGEDGGAPTAEQWRRLLERPRDSPITLINFFVLREAADYGTATPAPPCSGGEAMMRYAAVSGPTLEKVGGRFLLMAPFEAVVMGEDDDWDLVVVGQYPTGAALFALFDDPDYREAYAHRRAAVARQRVVALGGPAEP